MTELSVALRVLQLMDQREVVQVELQPRIPSLHQQKHLKEMPKRVQKGAWCVPAAIPEQKEQIGLPTPVPESSTFTVVVEAASAGPSLGANRGRELARPLVERDIGGAMASPRPG